MWQVRPCHEQIASAEIPDVVANKRFATGLSNEMKFVFFMRMPTA